MSENTNTHILLAGAFAAFTVDLLVYPLDTLKTRIQSPDYKKFYYNASQTAVDKPALFRGLYQGVGSVILITIPSSGAFFTTYEGVKALLTKANPVLPGSSRAWIPEPIIHSAASATAELVSCFILTPAEVLKQNAQMIRRSEGSHKSGLFSSSESLQALKTFQRPSQLFRGYTTLAARNLPFTAMQFPMFEHLKSSIKSYRETIGVASGSMKETAMVTAISAGCAGSIAAVLTTPIDVVKTHIMLAAAGEGSEAEIKREVEQAHAKRLTSEKLAQMKGVKRKGALTVAKEIINENGFRGLLRGATLRGVWTAVGSGLYLGVYETGRVWLGDKRDGNDDFI